MNTLYLCLTAILLMFAFTAWNITDLALTLRDKINTCEQQYNKPCYFKAVPDDN